MLVSLSGCSRYLDLNPGKTKEHCATLSGTGRPTWKGEGGRGRRDVALPKKLGEGRKARHDAKEERGG